MNQISGRSEDRCYRCKQNEHIMKVCSEIESTREKFNRESNSNRKII